MRAAQYAEALYRAAKEHPHKEDALLSNLTETLKANGHTHFLPRIVRSLERFRTRDEKEGTIRITSSRELTEKETQELLRKEPFKNLLDTSHKRVERVVDDSIIGGAIVSTKSQRVDGSYKRALLELYKSITN